MTTDPTIVEPGTPTRQHLPGLGSIFLRGRTWHCEFWKHGQQHRESTRTGNERKAIAFLQGRVEALAKDEYVGQRGERLTVAELLDLVTRDYANAGNRSYRTLRFRLAPLRAELGHLRAVQITSTVIEAYKARRLSQSMAKATVNRELAALRRAYKLASTAEPPLVSPARVPSVKMFEEDNVRTWLLDYTDYVALRTHLPSPIDDAVTFAYLSGWRRAEVLELTWREVDHAHGLITLRAERSKNKEPRELPLSQALRQLI